MHAFVAMPNYGLGAMYVVSAGSGFKSVLGSFEPVAMGEPIGAGYLRTINENPDTTGVDTFLSILGDPTLRFQLLAPPTNLSGNSGTNITLNWSASPEAGQDFVYRSINNLDGPWTKLTINPISSTTYNDNPAPSGSKMYRVRALKLTTTASGSYTNLSQGILHPSIDCENSKHSPPSRLFECLSAVKCTRDPLVQQLCSRSCGWEVPVWRC